MTFTGWGLSMETFTFTSALTHFQNSQGPKGFFWKFALAYLIGAALFFGVYIGAGALLVPGIVEASTDPYAAETFFSQSLGNILAFYGVIIVAAVIFGSMFEASALRHYVRRTGFSIGFGADELRLIGVYFFWMLTIFAVYIAVAVPLGIIIGVVAALAGNSGMMAVVPLMILLPIAVYCALIWVAVRLSPAAAVTIRDRKLTFLSARKATKGRFWALFGAFLVMFVVMYLIFIIVIALFLGAGIGLSGTLPAGLFEGDPGALAEVISNPVIWVLGASGFVIYCLLQSLFYFAVLGIPARAAVTDPTWNDFDRTAETFS